MKKLITFMLGICLIIPCTFMFASCKDNKPKIDVWDGTTIEISEAVNGVVTIETAEELADLARLVNEGVTYEGITIKLTCDIDLANREWAPIGFGSSNGLGEIDSTCGAYFKGVFDGQNKTIHNLKITQFGIGGYGSFSATAGIGLFGNIFNAEIKNLKLDDAYVVGNHFVGGLVGFGIGSKITNCHVDDVEVDCVYENDDDSGDKAGALVGFLSNEGAIVNNCSADDCEVKADRDAGQLIGCLSNGATQENNKVYDVEVSCNNSSSHVQDYSKRGQNIKNEIVGRIA